MLTRDQVYAADVYKKVSEFKKSANDTDKTSYGSMAHKLPVLIRTAGLAQALAFVEARGQNPQKQLLTDLAGTVIKDDKAALLQAARTLELSSYMRLTQQVLDALLWYKRFAQSVLDVKDASEGDNLEETGAK